MRIKAECCFHSVGQGLFYTGILSKRECEYEQFSFVYDCGSFNRSALNNEIDLFLSDSLWVKPGKKKKIDLLVISHFHADHINGLVRLLKKCEVDTAIIPYYTKEELAGFLADYLDNSVDRIERAAMLSFFVNPPAFLSDYSVKKVLLVNNHEKPYDEPEHEKSKYDAVGKDINPSKSRVILGDERFIRSSNNTRVSITYSNPEFCLDDFSWQFKFENAPINRDVWKNLIKDISGVLKGEPLKDFIKKGNFKEIRVVFDKYKKECGLTLNRTSLTMFHDAIHDVKKSMYVATPHGRYRNPFYPHCSTKTGTFVSGDIELNENEEPNILKCHGKQISFFQVPHHGSKDNWCKKNWLQYSFDSFIISHGIKNNFNHPHYTVVTDIMKERPLFLVNEYNRFSYTFFCDTDKQTV